jgi:SulP family sulfate permease
VQTTYDHHYLRHDLSAGLTVAFVALPQCMAYALIAGVDPQYGLYAFMVGSIVGALFGSSRHLQTGPTNATSIVVASTLAIYLGHDNFMGLVFLLGLLSFTIRASRIHCRGRPLDRGESITESFGSAKRNPQLSFR